MATSDDMRVEYTSTNHLNVIEGRFANVLKAAIEQVQKRNNGGKKASNDGYDDDESRQCRNRIIHCFKQNLHRAILENVKPSSSDQRVESSTADDDRIDYYRSKILPELETAFVNVASKRKCYPGQCSRMLRAKLESRLSEAVDSASSMAKTSKNTRMETAIEQHEDADELTNLTNSIATNLKKCQLMKSNLETRLLSLSEAMKQRRTNDLSSFELARQQHTHVSNVQD